MPPLLEEVGRRRFAFYPSIANAEPNEWQLRGATRSEVNAINSRTELEIWIPRHYLGTVSEIDDPILIVGSDQRTGVPRGSRVAARTPGD